MFSAALACPHWALLLQQQWDAFPPPTLPPLVAGPINPPSPGCHLLATSAGSCKPEGTAVSAVSHCCKCSFQGCSEDAEEEVCWVLNSSRSGAGRGCCSIHSAVGCTEASASGICRQLLQRAQSAAGSSAEPCRTRPWHSSLRCWVRRGVSFGSLGRREKCSCWRGFVLCLLFVQIQVKGGTTTN